MKIKYASYFFATVCFASLHAQQDSLQLNEVTVTDYRSKLTSKTYNEVVVDSSTRSAFAGMSASQLLLQMNTCFVKAYGPGNIASLSIRGSTAQQTAVVWNGVNINNPMLGQADVSLLPVSFFNSMSVQKGALSGYWGSGAMAGVLNLSSTTASAPLRITAGSSYSSLKNFAQYVTLDFSRTKLSGSTKIFFEIAQNRYRFYKNADSLIQDVQTHAAYNQFALLQDLSYSITKKQRVGLHVWFQQANRQSPDKLLAAKTDASLLDVLFRAVGDWKFTEDRFSVTARAAFLNEGQMYRDSVSGASSNSFSTFVADAEGEYHFKHGFNLTAGSTNVFSVAYSDGYGRMRQMAREAFYENLSWQRKRIIASVYGRQEIFDARLFVPTGGLNSTVNIFKWMSVSLSAGSVYRYPSLNELYWHVYGNPNLRPEKGFSEEGSIRVYSSWEKFSFSVKGTVFNRNITNWMIWAPGANSQTTAQNILRVWNRGAETVSEFSFRDKKISSSLLVVTNYILSTRDKTQLENDESVNRQMIFVPMYSGSATGVVQFGHLFVRVAYTYTGYRYLSNDNYDYLMPYQIVDARVGYTFEYKSCAWTVYGEVNNLFNENYISYVQYAMPLRNFKIGIQFTHNKPKKQT